MNFIINNKNQTYENYDTGITNYENYQNYDNLSMAAGVWINTNYDFNLNDSVKVQPTQNNTYETSIEQNKVETLILPLNLTLQEKKVDENKYLLEYNELKNQIKILKGEIAVSKTIERNIVKTVDNSQEILVLKQEIERLKINDINFESYNWGLGINKTSNI